MTKSFTALVVFAPLTITASAFGQDLHCAMLQSSGQKLPPYCLVQQKAPQSEPVATTTAKKTDAKKTTKAPTAKTETTTVIRRAVPHGQRVELTIVTSDELPSTDHPTIATSNQRRNRATRSARLTASR